MHCANICLWTCVHCELRHPTAVLPWRDPQDELLERHQRSDWSTGKVYNPDGVVIPITGEKLFPPQLSQSLRSKLESPSVLAYWHPLKPTWSHGDGIAEINTQLLLDRQVFHTRVGPSPPRSSKIAVSKLPCWAQLRNDGRFLRWCKQNRNTVKLPESSIYRVSTTCSKLDVNPVMPKHT